MDGPLGAGRGPRWATAAPFPDGSPHGSQVSFAFNTELEFMFFFSVGIYFSSVTSYQKREKEKDHDCCVFQEKKREAVCSLRLKTQADPFTGQLLAPM